MFCHCHKAKSQLQRKRPVSQHMVQCIAADIDVLQVELEWDSHQEEARPNHLLYRSSETESSPLVCTRSWSEPIQSEIESVLRMSAFVCVVRNSYRHKIIRVGQRSLLRPHTRAQKRSCRDTHTHTLALRNQITKWQPQAKKNRPTPLPYPATEQVNEPQHFTQRGALVKRSEVMPLWWAVVSDMIITRSHICQNTFPYCAASLMP